MEVDIRVRRLSDATARQGGRYVLYGCTRNRRVESNHALAFAAALANRLQVPLLCFESLGCGHPYDNDRMHTFVLEGVPDFAVALRKLGIGHVFHCARFKREAAPLGELLREAAAFVTDDYPSAPAVRPYQRLPEPLDVESYAVESSCVVPPACIGQRLYAAYSIRPRIHKLLPQYVKPVPPVRVVHRFRGAVPAFHREVLPNRIPTLVAECRIDHNVPPSASTRGGRAEAEGRLQKFLDERLRRYAREKNEPAAHATSGLSPYLHFGHVSSLEAAMAVRERALED